jgi:hypothetical protein
MGLVDLLGNWNDRQIIKDNVRRFVRENRDSHRDISREHKKIRKQEIKFRSELEKEKERCRDYAEHLFSLIDDIPNPQYDLIYGQIEKDRTRGIMTLEKIYDFKIGDAKEDSIFNIRAIIATSVDNKNEYLGNVYETSQKMINQAYEGRIIHP